MRRIDGIWFKTMPNGDIHGVQASGDTAPEWQLMGVRSVADTVIANRAGKVWYIEETD